MPRVAFSVSFPPESWRCVEAWAGVEGDKSAAARALLALLDEEPVDDEELDRGRGGTKKLGGLAPVSLSVDEGALVRLSKWARLQGYGSKGEAFRALADLVCDANAGAWCTCKKGAA